MKRSPMRRARGTFLILLLAAWALPAQALTWRVDLIVFRYLSDVAETGQAPVSPNMERAIELNDAQRLSAAGITILPDAQFGLNAEWQRLRSSAQFRPLIRLAWTQNDPPSENGPRLHLANGEPIRVGNAFSARELREVDGTVALHLGRFLHLDTDLIYTDPESGQSWRLQEQRRMRSDELHHLDSPRLGVIAVVSKWVP